MIDQNSQFYAILTAVGEAKQANATALGLPWTFSQMGVGDANGADPIPSRTQTSLINEWRRAPVNQVRTDPANPSIIITEQVIPADVGGKWIREIALYDADGDMVAVANCAPSFKPLLVQGTGKTQIIRMNFIVANTASVVLKIDPAIVLATREYVDNAVIEALAKLDFKHSALVATTANIVLSGLLTIDGVLLPADARVLVKNQTQAKDNGLYVVSSTGVWKRATDADSSLEVTPGLFVSIEKGTVNGDSVWQLVTDGPIVLGTTALVFEMAVGRAGISAGSYANVTVDKYGRVIAGTNPTTLAGFGITDAYTKAYLDAMHALKANLASPTFTGTPKVPTASFGTSTTQAASTEYVIAATGQFAAQLEAKRTKRIARVTSATPQVLSGSSLGPDQLTALNCSFTADGGMYQVLASVKVLIDGSGSNADNIFQVLLRNSAAVLDVVTNNNDGAHSGKQFICGWSGVLTGAVALNLAMQKTVGSGSMTFNADAHAGTNTTGQVSFLEVWRIGDAT